MAAISARFSLQVGKSIPFSRLTGSMAVSGDLAGCYFSRLLEFPEQCILLSTWNNCESRDRFIDSEEYEMLSNALSALNATVNTLDFSRGFKSFSGFLEGYNEIHTVYFPASFSKREKDNVRNVRGMYPILSYSGVGLISESATFASRERPHCAWFEQNLDYYGHQVAACIFVHSWKSPAEETQFKTIAPGWPDEDEESIPKSTVKFTRDMRRAGALDWENFHVYLERVL